MSRRTQDAAGRRLGPLAVLVSFGPALIVCAFFVAAGVLHVTSRVWVVRSGYVLSGLQEENRRLVAQHDRLKLELATLRNPSRLERAARELSLAPPSASDVIRLAGGAPSGPEGPERSMLGRTVSGDRP